MQKQKLYLLSLFLVMALTLSACGTGPQPGDNAPVDDIPVVETVAPLTDPVMTDTVATDTVAPVTDTVMTDTATTDAITATNEGTQPGTVTETTGMTATESLTGTSDAAATTEAGPLLLAYTLMEQSFVNADGEISGNIADLILDLRSGHILFAQVEYGGFLAIGNTELLVPLRALRWRSVEQDMILNFDEQLLETYPELSDLAEGSPSLNDPAWYDGMAAFWNDLGFGDDSDTVANIDPAANVIVRASDLLGYSLVDFGAGIGRIQNLLIELDSSRARYLLIGFDSIAADTDAYLLPFSAVDIVNLEASEIVLNANLTLETLQLAPRFDRSLFQDQIGAIDPIYREQADAFWEEQGFPLE